MSFLFGLFPALAFWNFSPGQGRGVPAWLASPSAAQLRRFELDFLTPRSLWDGEGRLGPDTLKVGV